MRVLITGGAGLIGSHLTRLLLDEGHEILVLDDFTFSYSADLSPRMQADIAYRTGMLMKGARIERCSTMEKSRLRALLTGFGPDCVVHLAAIPLVTVATRQVEAAARSLSEGMINMLEVLRDTPGVGRFVYASSSMVYGDFRLDPMPEDGPCDPVNVYGGLKLAGEVLTRAYLKPTGIETVIVRPSAVYGPTDQHRRVVQKFCEAALEGGSVVLSAKNDHTMDFTHVDDVAEGFRLAVTHPAAAGETFNMTYGQARRLTELFEVIRALHPGLSASSDPLDDHDRPTRGTLSIAKAARLLGYAPRYPLEVGIPAYLEHLSGRDWRMAAE
ncbi:NAD-dependent epimerase/dehydratase family protein [Haematobacter massiliensis]|uniref:NAD-dependent epimerase/dehydratase family protein n=1 Tax=Haematobacter massiliensis TaxID=195105 RepID=UPI0023F1A6FE|nr:NAD-dependent epimerase/dehydratase family protein [Haematobacter massiliensis]